ncbi:hypothetical protein [Sphaerisporangium sp. TRM90804]|uniref:hypothetical protein n=1 Tax=Sphaerisporangium sp. TRM90804 TaxID=3031113 RepID=UPI00244B330A|nr:hypothetical protein [Sphaerisporangium sp. TRM90804]MDH2426743.1 hypothetical protein [Sphaerisporangium sp. TRM90804]
MHPDSPISATLVAWGNAWLAGHVGLDEAVDRLERAAGPQVVSTEVTETPLRGFLADLRVEGMTALRLALPAAGDPLGLTGPAPFTVAAVDAGQAATAVLSGRCLGLIPGPDRRGSSYSGIRWAAMPASATPPDVPSLAEAEHALTMSMRAATDALLSVEGPGRAQPSLNAADDGLAPGYPARAHRVAALTARLASVLRVADERGLTSGQVAVRREAFLDLDRAVRRARVAAHNAITEPGSPLTPGRPAGTLGTPSPGSRIRRSRP